MRPTINPGPVFCAGRVKSIRAAQTTLPSMRSTLLGWLKPMVIGVVSTRISTDADTNGQAVSIMRDLSTSGLIQPGDAEKLSPAKEGERSWDNAILHVLPALDVPNGTRIIIKGVKYKVMGRYDYTANGYTKYELTETFS